ncbi:hypothetical protein NC653_031962 [Populus alba x Populus x berolinensis]|uniref:Uncharacterized protein n=1 Tax=Populus alba x Populus x berolinensis TaxID=444605 RepID=A0AAD6M028_9ROSI|nr:hypothetical protein NC653_031962 [Populus alba x Populus x berolinensis]
MHRPPSSPTSSPTPSNPARTSVAFADIVNLHRPSRVRVKTQNKGFHPTPSAAQPGSSRLHLHRRGSLGDPGSSNPRPGVGVFHPEAMPGDAATLLSPMLGKAPDECFGFHPTPSAAQSGSSRHNLHRSGFLGDPGSSNPRPGVGVLNLETMPGVEATSPSHMSGKASAECLGPSSPVPSSDAPNVPPSPPLVHFSNFTANSTCTFLETDVGIYKDRWRFSLIGFIAGKFPGYTSISTFVSNSWKCLVNFSIFHA